MQAISNDPIRKIGHARKKQSFKQEIFVLYYAIHDRRTPLLAKVTALGALAYLISPIDLIPDFIPVAGYLDDLVIVPLLLHIAFLVLPASVRATSMEKARHHVRKLNMLLLMAILIALMLLVGIFLFFKYLFHFG